MSKNRGVNKPKHVWTPEQERMISLLYPFSTGNAVAKFMGCSLDLIYREAKRKNIAKSEFFKNSCLSTKLRRDSSVGAPYRFSKGHVPANKGKPMPSRGRSAETQFKKGMRPYTWKPLGSERKQDGYIQIKMTDTGYAPRDWVPKHRLIWERLNGPIPPRHLIAFIDGNRLNVTITNLTLRSMRDNCLRNSVHNYGPEISQAYRLKALITRQINKRKAK